MVLVTATLLALPMVAIIGLALVKVRAPVIKYRHTVDAFWCAVIFSAFITVSIVVVQIWLYLLQAAELTVLVGLNQLASRFSKLLIDAPVFAVEAALTLFVANRLAIQREERKNVWVTAAFAAAFGAFFFIARHLPLVWTQLIPVQTCWSEPLSTCIKVDYYLNEIYKLIVYDVEWSSWRLFIYDALLRRVSESNLFEIAELVSVIIYPILACLFAIVALSSWVTGLNKPKSISGLKYYSIGVIPVASLATCILIVAGFLLWVDWFQQMYAIHTPRLPPDKLKELESAPLWTLYFRAIYTFGGPAAPIVWVVFPIAYALLARRVFEFIRA